MIDVVQKSSLRCACSVHVFAPGGIPRCHSSCPLLTRPLSCMIPEKGSMLALRRRVAEPPFKRDTEMQHRKTLTCSSGDPCDASESATEIRLERPRTCRSESVRGAGHAEMPPSAHTRRAMAYLLPQMCCTRFVCSISCGPPKRIQDARRLPSLCMELNVLAALTLTRSCRLPDKQHTRASHTPSGPREQALTSAK